MSYVILKCALMKRFCPLKQVILEIGYIFSDNLQRGFEEKVNTIKKTCY